MNRFLIILSATALTACGQSTSSVRITQTETAPPPVAASNAQISARSEPIFYNGKTYKLNFGPDASGGFAVAVIGMNASQAKDAKAFTTSAFHHYNCKDSQRTKFLSQPTYVDGQWQSRATCA